MTTRLLRLNYPLQLYTKKNLKSLSSSLRHFSNHNGKTNEYTDTALTPAKIKTEQEINWLNIRAGIFGPDDARLPLPGDVGVSRHLDKISAEQNEFNMYRQSSERLSRTLESLLTKQECRLEDIRQTQLKYSEMNSSVPSSSELQESLLECRIQDCPTLLIKDFQTLFPDIDVKKQRVQVLTFCQKTVNDMSSWSEMVEVEREELTEHFVDCTDRICDTLRSKGFWADFIDPVSGRPYSGAFTNSTFFETDERYRHLGFKIDDLGCCKVISHRVWGTKIFVGAMFTTAPIDEIEEALGPISAHL